MRLRGQEHLSLRGQGRWVVGRKGKRVVDLAPYTRQVAHYPEEAQTTSS